MSAVSIHEIFTSIQTEGPYAGCPAVFVRTHGCPVGCSFCDTDQKGALNEVADTESVAKEVQGILDGTPGIKLIVLTGGEPLAQKNFTDLLKALLETEVTVQIETSGFCTREVTEEDIEVFQNASWVISPKLGANKPYRLPAWLKEMPMVFLKMLYNEETVNYDKESVLSFIAANRDFTHGITDIYLQPLLLGDSDVTKVAKECRELCIQSGLRMSVQYHKLFDFA